MTGRLVGYLAVAVAAVSVAGLSGYLAGRTSTPAATQGQPVAVDTASPGTPGSAVSETEAAVPAAAPAEPTPAAPILTPAAAARDEPVEAPRAPVPANANPRQRQQSPSRQDARRQGASGQGACRREARARRACFAARAIRAPSGGGGAERGSPPRNAATDRHGRARRTSECAGPRCRSLRRGTSRQRRARRTAHAEGRRVRRPVRFGDWSAPRRHHLERDRARRTARAGARQSRSPVNGTLVIPAHARAEGQVTLVEIGRQVPRARAARRPLPHAGARRRHVGADSDRRDLSRRPVGGARSAARIGGSAVGGAIIGAIFGGGKGAAIGAAAGAGAGTAATMATQKSRRDAERRVDRHRPPDQPDDRDRRARQQLASPAFN